MDIGRSQGFEHFTKGYNDLKSYIDNGWKIDWLIGPPRSGTNTTVNMLAETPAVDGLHLRDAFYYHQGLIITPEEHFDIVCGLIAAEIDKKIAEGQTGPGHILVKDMPQPFKDEIFQRWLPLVSNFIVTYRDPHSTTLSLITALANDEHVKNTPKETDLLKNGDLFREDLTEYERGLFDSTIKKILDGEHTDLKYGHWNNMNTILAKITEHVEKNPEKTLSVFSFTMAQADHNIMKNIVKTAGLGVPETLTQGWTKAVAGNFRRVSSSQFSQEKFPSKQDPRKILVWEKSAIKGPFKLWPVSSSPSLDKFPEKIQRIITDNLLPFYIDVMRHPNMVGPKTKEEFLQFANQEVEGKGLVKDLIPVTIYAYGMSRKIEAGEMLEELKRNHPEHKKAFAAIDTAISAAPENHIIPDTSQAVTRPQRDNNCSRETNL